MGVFVTIEGPNGVGKSTFIAALKEELEKTYRVYITKEPSPSALGSFVRENEIGLRGRSYALLIAADRCFHLENFVVPNLGQFDVVVSDRYIESSLALQHADGLTLDDIWDINKRFLFPDISVVLDADSELLQARLSERSNLTYFEKELSRETERELYTVAADYLKNKGLNVHCIGNNTKDDMNNGVNRVKLAIEELF